MSDHLLVVDDDEAVCQTFRDYFGGAGFEVETASSTAEAISRLESAEYAMVISDLRMETEEAGMKVILAARRQSYDPATALLTAFPPSGEHWDSAESESLLIKPLGTKDLLRQLEALLVRHADDRQARARLGANGTQESPRKAG